MKRICFFITLFLFAWLSFAGVSFAEMVTGFVVHIKDGDTIVVVPKMGEPVTVRLYGVDCPEGEWEDRWAEQPFAVEAKAFTRDMVLNKTVSVRLTEGVTHGRVVGEVFFEDKVLNRELVRNGLAWWNKKFAPDDTALEALEAEAKKDGLGLWQEKDPTPPWVHRYSGE